MTMERIPLMFFPLSMAKSLGVRLKGLGLKMLAFYPGVAYDLKNLGIDAAGEYYCVLAFLSSLVWAVVLGFFAGLLVSISTLALPMKLGLIFLALLLTFLAFMLYYLAYPSLLAKSMGTAINRELIFVVRDMMIQISSGIPLFTVIENIGNSNYRYTSAEFRRVVASVKSGGSLIGELEALAIRTQSEYLKKTAWQLVTAIRSGADLSATLKNIVKLLVDYQFSLSRSFNAELNFIILIYMLVSAVLPTIGTTVLVIFSVFGLFGVTPEILLALVIISFFGQFIMIAYVHFKRPSFFSE